MGILDRLNATSKNYNPNEFDENVLECTNKLSHNQIYAGSDYNEYLGDQDIVLHIDIINK